MRFSTCLTAAALAVFGGIILPLQTFVPNASNYDYSTLALLPELSLCTVLLFVSTFVLLAMSDRYLRGYLTPVLAVVVVFAYLNAGMLSLGVPEINGELPLELQSVGRKVWDTALFAVAILAAVSTFRWTRTWLHWIPAGILVLGLASLADLHADERDVDDQAKEEIGNFAPTADLAENLKYSPTRNVLMIVLDAVPGMIANGHLERDAGLRSHFPGFVSYRQNIGMHDRTERGVPGIFTGKYFDESQNMGEYVMTSLGTNSFLRTYAAHGDAIYSMLDFFTYGLTTEPIEKKVRPENAPSRPYLLRDATEIPHLSLLDVVCFRMVPFIAKGPLLRHDIHTRRVRVNTVGIAHEHILYPILAGRPVSSDPRQVFAKFHTHGAHGPFCFELDGSPAKRGRTALEEVRVATSNNLVHVGRLMDALREKGVYDKAFIVVCSDHGHSTADDFPGNDRASALLMVKPDGAQGAFAFSAAPTGHQNLSKLMKRVCTKPHSADEVTTILAADRRLYREYDRHEDECHDWIYGPDGNLTKDSPEQ